MSRTSMCHWGEGERSGVLPATWYNHACASCLMRALPVALSLRFSDIHSLTATLSRTLGPGEYAYAFQWFVKVGSRTMLDLLCDL